jgi:hypothetical protein
MYLYQAKNKRTIHIFQLQSPILYIWRIHVIFFNVDISLFKLGILIQWKIWHNNDFMAC